MVTRLRSQVLTRPVRPWLMAGLLIWSALSASCATPPGRAGPAASVIGIRASIGGRCNPAGFVYFARVDHLEAHPIETNTSAIIWGEGLFSCYRQPMYVYLFNAQPGRYAPVAVGYTEEIEYGGGNFAETVTTIVYLPQTAIEQLTVTVGESEVVFVGDIMVEATHMSPPSFWSPHGRPIAIPWKDADKTQLHYYRTLAPGRDSHRVGRLVSVDRRPDAECDFLSVSSKLAIYGWESILGSPAADCEARSSDQPTTGGGRPWRKKRE